MLMEYLPWELTDDAKIQDMGKVQKGVWDGEHDVQQKTR